MNDGEVEGDGARVSEEDKENRAEGGGRGGGRRGGSHLSLATPACCEGKASSMQRGAMFHRETEGRRSRRRKSKKRKKKRRRKKWPLRGEGSQSLM